MKTLQQPLFILACFLWAIIYFGRFFGFSIPLLNDYLSDLLALPVICTLALAFMRKFMHRSNKYQLSFGQVVFVFLYLCLVFELILPKYSPRFTADWADVIAYAIGGVIYFKALNGPLE